jgi:transposase
MVQADRSEGRREEKGDGTSSAEREELIKLRREVRQLRLERDILSKAAAWLPSSGIPPADAGGTLTSLARETGTIPSGSSGS